MPIVKRVRVIVAGRVQGVFFRATCARLARDAGVGGFVRNRADGRVEAAFEGASEVIDRLVEWCRRGPDLARVDHVEILAEQPLGDVTFRIEG
jgi:acylphosphatase